MKLRDSLTLAFNTARSNKLRTGITVAIIAFGIMALIGIVTAITAMNQSLTDSFSVMGANSFTIMYRDVNIQLGGGGGTVKTTNGRRRRKKSNMDKPFTYEEAKLFKERYNFPARVSISLNYRNVIVSKGSIQSNPNVTLIGIDENYLLLSGYTLSSGRNLTPIDVQSGGNLCIIGSSVAKKLFPQHPDKALDQSIKVAGIKYRVVGILKDKGSSSFMNADNVVFTSYNNLRRLFPVGRSSFSIGVYVNDINLMEAAISEAKGTLRPIRKLRFDEDNNFYFLQSNSISEAFINSLSSVAGAAALIGLITLFSAAIGLMNIMLVAVNERTREIGLVKAIGGRASSIKAQFLFESVIISLMGAAFGIVLGILVGNIVGIFLETPFVIPWGWVITGVVTCTIVGLAAGIYPAMKAAKLDPIVALRYE
ncbi:MAG: ABC transporter permease [Chitinophagaceae bacterium]|nr:ABC transporter permease [Chitinophagaceae bacterium]